MTSWFCLFEASRMIPRMLEYLRLGSFLKDKGPENQYLVQPNWPLSSFTLGRGKVLTERTNNLYF